MTLFLAAALLLVLADRATKRLVRDRIAEGKVGWRCGPLEIRRVTAARHPMTRRQRAGLFVLGAATLVGVALLVGPGKPFDGPAASLALGAACGGAVANAHDLLRRGTVLDFVKVGRWPVFNVADAAITCGALSALLAWR